MARGFESKDVEFQQAESEQQKALRPALTPDERASIEQRRAVELSLIRARAELVSARTAAHRQMLTAAVASLEQQLKDIPRGRA